MKIGVIHYNFPGYSLTDFLRYASETGYGYLELRSMDVMGGDIGNPEARAKEVRKEVESFGLKVSALSAENDFIVLEEEVIKAQVERMGQICKLANILGASAIRTEGGRPKDSVPVERHVEAMARIGHIHMALTPQMLTMNYRLILLISLLQPNY